MPLKKQERGAGISASARHGAHSPYIGRRDETSNEGVGGMEGLRERSSLPLESTGTSLSTELHNRSHGKGGHFHDDASCLLYLMWIVCSDWLMFGGYGTALDTNALMQKQKQDLYYVTV